MFEYEDKLISSLKKNYNKHARPVTSDTTPINITFGIALPKLLKVVRE